MNVIKKSDKPWLLIFFITNIEPSGYNAYGVRRLKEETKNAGTENADVLLFEQKIIHKKTPAPKIITTLKKLLKKGNTYIYEPVTELDFVFDSGKCWAKFFSWINATYPTQKTAMMILSHGAGVGIYNESAMRYKNIKNRFLAISAPYKNTLGDCQNTPSRAVLNGTRSQVEKFDFFDMTIIKRKKNDSCKKIDMLWISELADALATGFGKRKIDLLFMVNCCTQTFETGWLLSKNVSYLTGPQSLFQALGYSYSALLKAINKNKDVLPEEIVKSIIPAFVKKWTTNEVYKKKLLIKDSISVLHLNNFDLLKRLFEKIVLRILPCTQIQLANLIKLRNTLVRDVSSDPPSIKKYGTHLVSAEFVDLNYFLDIITEVFSDDRILANLVKEFHKVFLSPTCLVDKYVGNAYLLHDKSPTTKKKYRISGISIYVPSNRSVSKKTVVINCAYFGKKRLTSSIQGKPTLYKFTKSSNWDEFILKYINALPK